MYTAGAKDGSGVLGFSWVVDSGIGDRTISVFLENFFRFADNSNLLVK
jgi:hypothetical protein